MLDSMDLLIEMVVARANDGLERETSGRDSQVEQNMGGSNRCQGFHRVAGQCLLPAGWLSSVGCHRGASSVLLLLVEALVVRWRYELERELDIGQKLTKERFCLTI